MARSDFALVVFVTAWISGPGCIEEAYDPIYGGQNQGGLSGVSDGPVLPTAPENAADTMSPDGRSVRFWH